MVKTVVVVLLLAAIVVAVGPNLVDYFGQRGKIKTPEELAGEQHDCIIVLGAAVFPDGTPTTILKDRIQVAADLYKAGVAPKIIMSGDNQSDRETYNEVFNMKRYAVEELGVPSEDVFCDHAGLNTYDSMYRAYHVFGAQRIVVVTQTYHLYRALFDAASFHMEAVGVPADLRTYLYQTYYDAREVLARVSDTLKVIGKSVARRQYIYVKDLAKILAILATGSEHYSAAGNIAVNVGMPKAYTNLEIAEIVNEVFENATPIDYDDSQEETSRPFHMDVTKLADSLSYQPKDLREALEEMAQES